MKPIPLQEVESSNVAAVGYDASTERFGVRFKSSDTTYVYAGVPAKVAADILEAPSIGRAVSAQLARGGYETTKIEPKKERT